MGLAFLVLAILLGVACWYIWSLWSYRKHARQFAKPRRDAVVDYADKMNGHYIPSGTAKPLPTGVLPLSLVASAPGGKGLLSRTAPPGAAPPAGPRPPAGPSPRARGAPSPFPSGGLGAPRQNPLSASVSEPAAVAVVVANPAAGF